MTTKYSQWAAAALFAFLIAGAIFKPQDAFASTAVAQAEEIRARVYDIPYQVDPRGPEYISAVEGILTADQIAVTLGAAAAPAFAASGADQRLPTLEEFARSVVTGTPGQVVGVYVPEVLALRVVPQPEGNLNFVDKSRGTATLFQLASPFGVTGLLAHNYLSGQLFFKLSAGQEVWVVYGDGQTRRYVVRPLLRYQALEPRNTRGDLVDLSTGGQQTTGEVLARVYTGGDRVTFQTCIAKKGDRSWGRLFVIAEPAE